MQKADKWRSKRNGEHRGQVNKKEVMKRRGTGEIKDDRKERRAVEGG